MAAVVAKDEEHAWEEMSELAHLVQHNAAVRLQLLEVEDMLVAWMDLPPESPVLHLPPASPYFRMLVHRLVEAFGVTHVSFGEGEDRHIVLQRNEDSEVPPLLLLDVLSVADGPSLPSAAPQILRRLSECAESLVLSTWNPGYDGKPTTRWAHHFGSPRRPG